jgi:hypothetical protein
MSGINQQIQAAQLLGKEIIEEYKMIEGNFCVVVIIKAGKDQSFPIPMKKEEVLKKLEKEKTDLQTRLKKVESDIKTIKGMKC